MKGIILAGGTGSRLYPATLVMSKQLLPIHDKPMIYYPLSTLMLANIRQILIITATHEKNRFEQLLGDGSQWGIQLDYATQDEPDGIPQAFVIGESFIGKDPVCLMLGDNLLYGHGLSKLLQQHASLQNGAHLFAYPVRRPQRYGVVEFDAAGKPKSIIEKPQKPTSRYAIIGLYFYDHHVVDIAKQLKKSGRGEYEITDINQYYLTLGQLQVSKMGRGIAWLDTGTHESLLKASKFIEVIEERTYFKIGSPEEIAWRMGYIDSAQLENCAHRLSHSDYGQYLLRLINEN